MINKTRIMISKTHFLSTFQDMTLLKMLLEVTADPIKYYTQGQDQSNPLAQSFIDVISSNIQQFYSATSTDQQEAAEHET